MVVAIEQVPIVNLKPGFLGKDLPPGGPCYARPFPALTSNSSLHWAECLEDRRQKRWFWGSTYPIIKEKSLTLKKGHGARAGRKGHSSTRLTFPEMQGRALMVTSTK